MVLRVRGIREQDRVSAAQRVEGLPITREGIEIEARYSHLGYYVRQPIKMSDLRQVINLPYHIAAGG